MPKKNNRFFLNWMNKYSHVNWAVADQALISSVNFVFSILLARYLGLEVFGFFSLLWMVFLLLNGIQMALIISPMFSLSRDSIMESVLDYYGSLFVMQLVFSVLTCVVVYIGLEICGVIFPQWGVQGLELSLIIAVFFVQIQEFLRRYFFALDKGIDAFINDMLWWAVDYIIFCD